MERKEKEIAWLLKDKYSGVETPGFKKDVLRFKKGEPLDYVIGFCEFLGCRIDLSKRPLIPRPETEFWVDQAISEIKHQALGKKIKVLDIFAGSGCIGISVMRHMPGVGVTFAEKDKGAIGQIKINFALNKTSPANSRELAGGTRSYSNVLQNIGIGKYKVIQSDMFDEVAGKYDYMFANPPYIPTVKKKKIQKSVLHYEPAAALFAGKDGLFYIRRFLAKAPDFLNSGGKIYMEFDSTQRKPIQTLLKKYGYKTWEFHKDQYGRWRYVVVSNL